MDIQADEVLVLASDPVTLAADALSRYVVLVNANDVATSGATPRWLVATLLFPPGSTGVGDRGSGHRYPGGLCPKRHLSVWRAHRGHRLCIPAACGGDDGGDRAEERANRQAPDAAR